MPNHKKKTVQQLLAEADELMRVINSNNAADRQDEYFLQLEKHADQLKHIKSKVQTQDETPAAADLSSSSEGIHEAIVDIIDAMHDLKKKLF